MAGFFCQDCRREVPFEQMAQHLWSFEHEDAKAKRVQAVPRAYPHTAQGGQHGSIGVSPRGGGEGY
jgi:hypothetical protein